MKLTKKRVVIAAAVILLLLQLRVVLQRQNVARVRVADAIDGTTVIGGAGVEGGGPIDSFTFQEGVWIVRWRGWSDVQLMFFADGYNIGRLNVESGPWPAPASRAHYRVVLERGPEGRRLMDYGSTSPPSPERLEGPAEKDIRER